MLFEGISMHVQHDLFRPMCGRQHQQQRELFNEASAADSDLSCEACGQFLVRTESGFLSCPNGHGNLLIEAVEDERCGRWFDDDLPEPPPDFPASTMRAHACRLRADR